MIASKVWIFMSIVSCLSICKGTLFPIRIFDDELYLPNKWTSVTDCPVRYYDHGRSGVASSVFGREAYEREFAHIAAIGWIYEDGEIEWNCGGSLISENYIVTAGHCMSWKGKSPDVARMGDLNLENDTDDKWAQQITIEKVIPHPLYNEEYSYYDIALLKLSEPIKVHDTVCPACLWTNDTIRFQFMEAVGFLGSKTPKLLEVTLSPVKLEDCRDSYPPRQHSKDGLKDHQMCAADRAHMMDICLRNSEGPLQIKLLGNGKMNPFLIGITSYGKSCEAGAPVVYTRVSSFIDWIESVTNIDTDPRKCAFNYSKYREYEPDVILNKNDKFEYLDLTKFQIGYTLNHHDYIVECGGCTGVLLTETFVLTSASCMKLQSTTCDKIKTKDGTEIKIKTVTLHPSFKSGGIDNDIALVELVSEVTFNDDVRPACLYSKSHIPPEHELDFVGKGFSQNLFSASAQNYNESEERIIVSSRTKHINYTYCSQFYEPEGIKVDEQSQICYANMDYYLVPDSCEIAPGAPIERSLFVSDRFFSYAFGLPTRANDCGFGFPAVASRFSYYIDWIDSVIFPDNEKKSDVHHEEALHEVLINKRDALDCPTTHRQYRRTLYKPYDDTNGDEFAHLALIGYVQTMEWHCRGNLISDKHVLTSQECFKRTSDYDAAALGNVNAIVYNIAKSTTNDKSLTLLTLDKVVSFSQSIIPICLWMDPTKMLFKRTFIVSKMNSSLTSTPVRPYQSSACRKMKIGSSITSDDQSCVKFLGDPTCTSPGTGIHSIRNESGLIIPYLVGQLDDVNRVECVEDNEDAEYAFTKVAPHVDWILANM